MSIDRCIDCAAPVDTDQDADCHVEVEGDLVCVCRGCRSDEKEDWWVLLLKEYRADGQRDADRGRYNPPYPGSDDPEDACVNEAYRRGFYDRRSVLGNAFEWEDE
ncbi:MAG TPA: hypothetical protein VK973_12655 [Arenicellales bacterium]|nr:hypothetical protein [Arenicellales bacterium]